MDLGELCMRCGNYSEEFFGRHFAEGDGAAFILSELGVDWEDGFVCGDCLDKVKGGLTDTEREIFGLD